MLGRLALALRRSRVGILIIAAAYASSLLAGMVMAHTGSQLALERRDAIVAQAHRADPASRADDAGAHGRAALLDFSRNLGLAAIPDTIGGLALVLPVATALYRGWVGGIVSVDGKHRSRLGDMRSAVYYLVTLALQVSGFTLAGGGGVHLGWEFLNQRGPFVGPRWLRLPRPALVDVACLYALIVPLFALGSLWEFVWPGA